MYYRDVIRLVEMNVSNLDTIKTDFVGMLDALVQTMQVPITASVRDLIVKRAVKAMQNDDAGHMVRRKPIDLAMLPDSAPAWLRKALESGDTVYEITFKEGFQTSLAHVVDWLRVDPDAAKVVKAAPEDDFLGRLSEAADAYFAKQQAAVVKQEGQSLSEPGREVIMTFRQHPKADVAMMTQDSDLASTVNGPVVAFWAKLTTAAALDREGKLMKHCVGSYADLVASESVMIYSLRDMKNEPHATVELRMDRGAPTINQVKGKANQAPLGRYARYIKDFLNALGVQASNAAAEDVKGLGLLVHDGKFGTILDVGGIILTTFANGDTIRTLRQSEAGGTWQPRQTHQQYMYVEKDGTVPFVCAIRLTPEQEPTAIEGRQVVGFTMLRKEVSRFPTYARHMIAFLNQHGLRGVTKSLDQIGVFYDARRPIWGTRADLTEHLFDYKGVSVSRIAEDVFFADTKNVVFATAQLLRNTLRKIVVINPCEATHLLPELVLEFGNRVIQEQMSDKEARDYFANYGAFWNNGKNKYTGVPEDRAVLFQAKSGRVCAYMNRLFFYDPRHTLMASIRTGKDVVPYKIDENDLVSFGATTPVFDLLADMTAVEPAMVTMGYFDRRKLREAGFFIERARMLVVAEVEKDQKLGDGYVAATRISDHGGKIVTLLKAGQQIASMRVDDEQVGKRIEMSSETPETLSYVAAMLNAVQARMSMIALFSQKMQIKHDRYAPLDPKRDAMMLDFLRGRIDLGHGFRFDLGHGFRFVFSGYIDRLTDRDRDRDSRFGYVSYEDDDYDQTVCYIDWVNGDELAYRMPRTLPPPIHRADVIKTVGRFMQFYHDKIERYLSSELWIPSK